MCAHHELMPSTDTMHWGYLDGALDPVIRVSAGDTVTLHSVAGGAEYLPNQDFPAVVLDDHRAVLDALPRGPGPHILTGPVWVEGAEPGDALRVDIVDVRLRDDWAFNVIRPTAGTLPDDYPVGSTVHLQLDRENVTARTPWGIELPARPFFGLMATAPRTELGRLSSIAPGPFGGNMDIKELIAGATLFLPVFVPGALFSAGDSHALQGDGEVCVTAAETSLVGTFRLDLVKGAALAGPRAQTPTHLITMGFDENLETAVRMALRDLISWIMQRGDLDSESAYRLCSLAGDLRVSQMVNQKKGIHMMLPLAALGGR